MEKLGKLYKFLSILNVVVLLLLEVTSADLGDADPVVLTKYGKVRGIRTKEHYEFRKIPFAKPPLGQLRFKVRKL